MTSYINVYLAADCGDCFWLTHSPSRLIVSTDERFRDSRAPLPVTIQQWFGGHFIAFNKMGNTLVHIQKKCKFRLSSARKAQCVQSMRYIRSNYVHLGQVFLIRKPFYNVQLVWPALLTVLGVYGEYCMWLINLAHIGLQTRAAGHEREEANNRVFIHTPQLLAQCMIRKRHQFSSFNPRYVT